MHRSPYRDYLFTIIKYQYLVAKNTNQIIGYHFSDQYEIFYFTIDTFWNQWKQR